MPTHRVNGGRCGTQNLFRVLEVDSEVLMGRTRHHRGVGGVDKAKWHIACECLLYRPFSGRDGRLGAVDSDDNRPGVPVVVMCALLILGTSYAPWTLCEGGGVGRGHSSRG